MIICGIDPSTSCTGVSIVKVSFNPLSFSLIDKSSLAIKPSKKFDKPFDKKVMMLSLFEQYIADKDDIEFFVFENYSYGSLGRLDDLAECCSLLKFKVFTLSKPFDVIAPMTVKKLVGGSGKSTKEDVQNSLYKFFPKQNIGTFKTFDESDAVAVAVAYMLKMSKENEHHKSGKNLSRDNDTGKKGSSKRRRVSSAGS